MMWKTIKKYFGKKTYLSIEELTTLNNDREYIGNLAKATKYHTKKRWF